MHLQIGLIVSCHLCLFWCVTLDAKELVGETVPTPGYIGCYKETASGKTAMTHEAKLWKENPTNATDCARFCRKNGFNYASLQFSRCFCGLSFTFVELLNDALCEGDCATIQRLTVSYRVGKISDGLRCGHEDVSAIYTVCPLHYYGEWCTENCNCLDKPCESKNGRCPGGNCLAGWSGPKCSIFKPCATNTCQNGGECRQTDANDNGYVCSCPYGFQGDNCEKGAEVLGPKVNVVLMTTPKEFYVFGIPYKADVPVNNKVHGPTTYVGCYPDPDSTDVPENFLEVNDPTTIDGCILHCSGRDEKFTVVAIKAGTQCRCANAYGKHGKGNESECSARCNYGKDHCGGAMANSIYTICPLGKYTTLCSLECHCADQKPCDLETGICDSSCIEGWSGKQCNKADLNDTYTLLKTVKMINIVFAVIVAQGLGLNVYCYYSTYMAVAYDKEVALKAKEEEKEKKRKKEEKEMEEKKEKEDKQEREERRKRRRKRREEADDDGGDDKDDAYEDA